MAQCCSFIGYITVTTDRTSIGGIARFRAGWLNYFCLIGVVTGCRYYLSIGITADAGISNNPILTTGSFHSDSIVTVAQCCSFIGYITVTTDSASVCGEASLGAGRLSYNGLIVVTSSGNHFGVCVAAVASIGDGTILRAGCIHSDCLVFMAQCLDFIRCIAVTTDSASAGGEASLGAGGLGYNGLIVVTGSGNHFGVSVAAMAGIGDGTILSAGCIYSDCFMFVTQCLNFIRHIAVITDRASIGGEACLGAGGLGYNGIITMPQCCGFICSIAVIALAAGIDSAASFCTGRCSSNTNVIMTQSFCLVTNIAVTTDSTGIGGAATFQAGGLQNISHIIVITGSTDNLSVGIAADTGIGNGSILAAGCINGNRLMAVAQCFSLVGIIGITTDSTTIGGIATLQTGRFHDLCTILMIAGSRNRFGIVIAAVAGVGNRTIYTTCGINCFADVFMTSCFCFVGNIAFATNVAGMGGKSCFLAGRFGNNRIVAVTGGRNHFCISITAVAGIDSSTDFSTSRCLRGGFMGMPQSLRIVILIAVAAICTSIGGIAALRAGGCSHYRNIGMSAVNADSDSTDCLAFVNNSTGIIVNGTIEIRCPGNHILSNRYGLGNTGFVCTDLDDYTIQNQCLGNLIRCNNTLNGMICQTGITFGVLEQTYCTGSAGNCKAVRGIASPYIAIVQIPGTIVSVIHLISAVASGSDMPVALVIITIIHIAGIMINSLTAILGQKIAAALFAAVILEIENIVGRILQCNGVVLNGNCRSTNGTSGKCQCIVVIAANHQIFVVGAKIYAIGIQGKHLAVSGGDPSVSGGCNSNLLTCTGCRLSRSRFRRSGFRGSRFRRSRFRGSRFRGSRFRGSRFRGSGFCRSRFCRSGFRGSRFRRSRLSDLRN